jgi:hypothetical protein
MRRQEHALWVAAAKRNAAYMRTPEGRALLSEAIGAVEVSDRVAKLTVSIAPARVSDDGLTITLLDADGPRP